MFTISIPFPTKRDQRRKKGKKPAGAGKGGPAPTAAAAAAKPPRTRPAWDATATDLGKHRLTAAEMVSLGRRPRNCTRLNVGADAYRILPFVCSPKPSYFPQTSLELTVA